MGSAEFGVRSAECGVRSLEWESWRTPSYRRQEGQGRRMLGFMANRCVRDDCWQKDRGRKIDGCGAKPIFLPPFFCHSLRAASSVAPFVNASSVLPLPGRSALRGGQWQRYTSAPQFWARHGARRRAARHSSIGPSTFAIRAAMQSYDFLMLAVLIGCMVFGAWKGMAWQVASLASIGASYLVAVRFSETLAPVISAEAPWNKAAAMLILYVATS